MGIEKEKSAELCVTVRNVLVCMPFLYVVVGSCDPEVLWKIY